MGLMAAIMLLILMLLLLLLLLRLRVSEALLIAEQLPLQAVILRLEEGDLPSHLLIVDAAHVVVLVVGRLEQQVALVPLKPDPQLPFVGQERTVIFFHLVRVEIRLHYDTFVRGLLGVVTAERGPRQADRGHVRLLVAEKIG